MTSLLLDRQGLTELPALPADLVELSAWQLRTLDLGHNRLTSLPSRMPDVAEYLYLHDNRLRALPSGLRELRRLRYLNVSGNPLGDLPGGIGELAGLVELRAEGSGLTALPDSIGRLGSLHELSVRDNAITALTPRIGDLTNLRRLDLRNNGLRALPEEILGLPVLDKLDLRWNRDLDVPWLAELGRRGCVVWPLSSTGPRRALPGVDHDAGRPKATLSRGARRSPG